MPSDATPGSRRQAEGPNEHTLTLLPTGVVLCVFRTEAGDGNGRCEHLVFFGGGGLIFIFRY